MYAPARGLEWRRRYHAVRGALVRAVESARSDAEIWRNLTEECPALATVGIGDGEGQLGAAIDIVSPTEAESFAWRMRAIGESTGPTWNRGNPPSNRDLALQVILSGWVPSAWRGSMTVADAIKSVVANVRTYRREQAK